MKKLKTKLIILAIVFCLLIAIMQISVYATNENVKIVKESATDYLIYIKNNLDTDFSFAFSNSNTEPTDYTNCGTDSTDAGANKIAFINNSITTKYGGTAYIWAKAGSNYLLNGVQIDLTDSITQANLNFADNITKAINVDTTQITETKETINDIEKTTKLGKIVLLQTGNFEYQLVKLPNSIEYNNFMNLADRISKFNSSTNIYTKIEVYKEFYDLYLQLSQALVASDWTAVNGTEIVQPLDSENGEQYILWLKNSNGTIDTQFLTSSKEVSEEKIVETITTKLPVTYDNNILLIILVILVIPTIIIGMRIKMLKSKEEK